jgi:hypothetical protein
MRGMIGNSGNGNSIVSNPWMTAMDAALKVPTNQHQVSRLLSQLPV